MLKCGWEMWRKICALSYARSWQVSLHTCTSAVSVVFQSDPNLTAHILLICSEIYKQIVSVRNKSGNKILVWLGGY